MINIFSFHRPILQANVYTNSILHDIWGYLHSMTNPKSSIIEKSNEASLLDIKNNLSYLRQTIVDYKIMVKAFSANIQLYNKIKKSLLK